MEEVDLSTTTTPLERATLARLGRKMCCCFHLCLPVQRLISVRSDWIGSDESKVLVNRIVFSFKINIRQQQQKRKQKTKWLHSTKKWTDYILTHRLYRYQILMVFFDIEKKKRNNNTTTTFNKSKSHVIRFLLEYVKKYFCQSDRRTYTKY